MIEAPDVNSTFYALRLLSHRLDISEIDVTDGEAYPASEFTREEQEQALKILQAIEGSESESLNQLPLETIHFYLSALADRIEELADHDLANAGYDLQLPALPSFQEVEEVLMQLEEQEVQLEARGRIRLLVRDVLSEMEPQLRRCAELYVHGSSVKDIAEKTGLPMAAAYRKLVRVQELLVKAIEKWDVKEAEAIKDHPRESLPNDAS